jgi:hypothetical protein
MMTEIRRRVRTKGEGERATQGNPAVLKPARTLDRIKSDVKAPPLSGPHSGVESQRHLDISAFDAAYGQSPGRFSWVSVGQAFSRSCAVIRTFL